MIHAQLEADGSGIVTIAGHARKLRGTDLADARAQLTALAVQEAATQKNAVTLTSSDPSGTYNLVVHPDGRVEQADRYTHHAVNPPGVAEQVEPPRGRSTTPQPGAGLRETSFLTAATGQEAASQGLRGLMARLGISTKPSAKELAERDDIAAVSQHWAGPRTIAVVNRKGGSNKTPTVAALSAAFARHGGGGVLAWDNNENQGTLGWRTEQGRTRASVIDVLRDQQHLLSARARQADIDGYIHHQAQDKYDVLRSDENNEGDHEISAAEVHAVHAIVERYRRLIIMDSGNTARAANWRAMIEHTDQLVVPTTTMEDRAEAAKLTLQTLAARDEHSAHLARNAVVIISGWKPGDQKEARRIRGLFEPLVRAVVTVPYDPAMKAGQIRYSAMNADTQRAWLAAAAAVARGL